MRWNIRRLRLGFWVLTLLAAGFSGSKLLAIVQDKKKGLFDPRPPAFFQGIIESGRSSTEAEAPARMREIGDFERTWKSPINGYKPEPVVQRPKVDPNEVRIPDLRPIEDVLTLKNLTYSPEQSWCIAVFKYKDEDPAVSQEELVVPVGGALKYPYSEEPFLARLVRVTPEGAVVSWGGEEKTVRPPLAEDAAGAGDTASADTDEDVGLTDREREVLGKHRGREETMTLSELGPESYLVGTGDAAANTYEDWKSSIRARDQRTADGRSQVVVQSVPVRVQRAYGVQSGDVLVSINGVAMSSKTQAINYVTQYPDEPKYVVVIRRLGKEITKTFYPPQE